MAKGTGLTEGQETRWAKKSAMHPWLEFLTTEERATVQAADLAKAEWKRLQAERAAIQNRAIQRCKYAGRAALAERGGSE